MALNSRILAEKSQVFGVMGISNADKEFVLKVRSTCSHLPKRNRNRSVPISPELYELIPKRGLYEGKLFPPCYDAFEYAAENSGVKLPEGQLSHVLRHTFASHFMMNSGNILVLQRILGHSTITMTMRYAHFAPDHLDDAVRLNPLASPHS